MREQQPAAAQPCLAPLVPPSAMSHPCVCRQDPRCLRCLPSRDHLSSTLGLLGYKYQEVARGSRAKAQPDTIFPSFTVTFCQMPAGRGLLICWHTLW